ncbi:hypothetical protein WJX73_006931 [Symbiochloris irregularis]|uniref:DUF1279 domain-containing protein n=1 Tax=Symbiochloris irregularis TaxID=706552 RepID=A0AAW1NRQ8_9CHLO
MSYADTIRTLMRKYGKIGLATHLSIYAATFSGFYYAAESKMNITEHLQQYGLLSGQDVADEADPQKRGWLAETLTHGGSSLALAFLCTKATLPVRVPLTVAITPAIARALRYKAAKV